MAELSWQKRHGRIVMAEVLWQKCHGRWSPVFSHVSSHTMTRDEKLALITLWETGCSMDVCQPNPHFEPVTSEPTRYTDQAKQSIILN